MDDDIVITPNVRTVVTTIPMSDEYAAWLKETHDAWEAQLRAAVAELADQINRDQR